MRKDGKVNGFHKKPTDEVKYRKCGANTQNERSNMLPKVTEERSPTSVAHEGGSLIEAIGETHSCIFVQTINTKNKITRKGTASKS